MGFVFKGYEGKKRINEEKMFLIGYMVYYVMLMIKYSKDFLVILFLMFI